MNSPRVVRFALALVFAAPLTARAQAAPETPPPAEPLTLRRAVELALQRAPQLGEARAAHEEGAASAELARDQFQPSALFTTSPGYTYGMPSTVVGRVPAVVGLEIRTAIYDPTRKSAALQAEATESSLGASLESTCRGAAESAVAAYARVYLDAGRVEAARRRVEASDATARRIEALYGEGRRTQLDVERARLSAARSRQKVLNAESDRQLDELELRRLIGWPPTAPIVLAGDPETAIPDLRANENLAAVRSADPGLRSLGREVQLLGESARLESKRWAPIVEASAQYQRLAKFNNYDKYFLSYVPDSVAVGVSIALPLWTGGRFDDSKRQALARLDRAEAQLRSREADVEVATRRSEAAVARTMAEQSLMRREQGLVAQTLSAERLLVQEGRSDLDELEARALDLADADEQTSAASLDALLQRVRLLSLRGELAKTILGAPAPCGETQPAP
jgi:outer membrane protein TolC